MKRDLILDIIELAVSTVLTIGTERVISKTVDDIYEPTNNKEKIISKIGKLGLAMAIDAGIGLYLHNALEVFREEKEEKTDIKVLEEKLDRILEGDNTNGKCTDT